MKKKISLLLAMLMLVSALTGCGGGTSAKPDPGTKQPTEGGKVVLPISGTEVDVSIFQNPQDFTFACVRSGGTDEISDLLMKLSEIPNLNPAYKYFDAAELDTQMNLALTAGEKNSPYDMFRFSLRSYRDFAPKGLLLPLEDYMEKYDDMYHFYDDIPESLWSPLREMGTISAIPMTVNVQHMFYRKDIFDKYNLTPPTNIDEWIEVCEKLKDVPEVEYPLALSCDKGNGAATEFVNMMYGADEDFFDENENPIFNQAPGVECLEKLIKLASYCPEGVTSATGDDTMVLMQTGKVAMLFTWASRAPYMDDETVSSVAGKVAYAPAPIVNGKRPYANLSVEYMVVPANIKGDPEGAFLALAEMTSKEAQASVMTTNFVARTSPVEEHPEILESRPNAQAVSDTVSAGASVGNYHPGFGLCWTILSTYVAMAMDGEMTAQEALDQAAAESIIALKDAGILK